MTKIMARIYGGSDDCVEVVFHPNPNKQSDEYYAYEGGGYLKFSDGSIIHIEYAPKDMDEAVWRVKRIKEGTAIGEVVWHGCEESEDEEVTEDNADGNSDVYELTGEDLQLLWYRAGVLPEERDLSTPEKRLREMDELIEYADECNRLDEYEFKEELVRRMKDLRRAMQ